MKQMRKHSLKNYNSSPTIRRSNSSPCIVSLVSDENITLQDLEERVYFCQLQNNLLLNLQGLHFKTSADVNNLKWTIERKLHKTKSQLEAKGLEATKFVTCFVNYDECSFAEDILPEYTVMVQYLNNLYYKEVSRYTVKGLYNSLKSLESSLVYAGVSGAKIKHATQIGNYLIEQDGSLGAGSFAEVKKAICEKTGAVKAVKIIRKQMVKALRLEQHIEKEIEIMKMVNHPYIVHLVDNFETEDYIYLVMDHLPEKLLQLHHEDEHEPMPEAKAKAYMKQLIDALVYLHEKAHVVHRDIKEDNICISDKGHVVLIDFGCADLFRPGAAIHTLFAGNNMYVPPEVLMRKSYIGPEVDVWAYGVVLFRLLTGFLPFLSPQKALTISFTFDIDSEPISKEAKDLVKRIFVMDPQKRITTKEIQKHPWFRECAPSQQEDNTETL